MYCIYENINLPIWIKNSENKIIFTNNKFKNSFRIEELKNEILKEREEKVYLFEHKDKIYKHMISINNKNNLMGIIIDVCDVVKKYGEQKHNHILNAIIDNIPEIIFYKDKDLRYMKLNKECKKFYLNNGINDVIGKNDLELSLDEEFVKTCYKHDNIVLNKKETLYVQEKIHKPNSQEYTVFQTIKTPVLDEKGEVFGLVGIVRDITEQSKREENLIYLSYRDSLTGIYNRTYFEKKIKEIEETKQYPLGIIIGDLDGLKIVNDTFGHLEGDKLIKDISSILIEACIGEDLVFRWGGDEFITLLPNATQKECKNYIDRVNKLCKNLKKNKINMSISLGYSLLEEDMNIDKVLIEAEEKVYKQKMINSKFVKGSILSTLKNTLELKNLETKEHTNRVARYCEEIGKALHLDEETIEELSLVGELHDIGKIGIPEHILLKPEKLNNEEYEVIKTHSEKGYRLAMLLPELSHVAKSILTHHEKWDGSGYPLGLKGEEIPLIARIVAVADSFDAMTKNRVYSKGISKELAIKELKLLSGKQFDPKVVEVFCDIIEKKDNI